MNKSKISCYSTKIIWGENSFPEAVIETIKDTFKRYSIDRIKQYFSYVLILDKYLKKSDENPEVTISDIFNDHLYIDSELAFKINSSDVLRAQVFSSDTEIGKALIDLLDDRIDFIVKSRIIIDKNLLELDLEPCEFNCYLE